MESSPEAAPITPPKTSGQAVWSLILGILSNTCLWIFGSIPAIILGILAIRKIDRNPREIGGKGLAIAGIITGAVGVIIGLIVLGMVAAIVTPAFSSINAQADLTKQKMDVRQLIMACHQYANEDPDAEFPPTLKALVEAGILDNESLLRARNRDSDGTGGAYIYQAGVPNDGTKRPLILGPGWLGGKRIVGYSDGTVEAVREDAWEEEVGL